MSHPILIQLPVDLEEFSKFDFRRQLDTIVDLFESNWKKGNSPVISEYVRLVDPPFQERLMRELVLVERECFTFLSKTSEKNEISKSDTVKSTGHETLDASPNHCGSSGSEQPTHFDRFAIKRLLGRGSHGMVYEAEDLQIRRHVALKIAHSSMGSDSTRAFAREATNASRVDHPSIVRILEVGDHRGTQFMVSELIVGQSLSVLAASQKLDDIQSSKIVADIAAGVEAAHGCGVIHRDLKPSNIMIEVVGEIAESNDATDGKATFFSHENFRVRILDFGIAKLLDRLTRQTRQGDIVGTPHYMSPEQASGNSANVDRRSDIFSLGVILFELLTGKLPFDGSEAAVVSGIRDLKVPSIRSIRADVPKGLEHITHKCLERNPAHRYQTAAELESDLRKWLDGEKPSVLLRRERKLVAKGFVSIAVLCMLIGMTVLMSRTGSLNGDKVPITQSPAVSPLYTWLEQGKPGSLVLWMDRENEPSLLVRELREARASRRWEESLRWRLDFAELCLLKSSKANSEDLKQLAGNFIESLDASQEKAWLNALLKAPDEFVNEIEPRDGLLLQPKQRQLLFGIVANRWEKSSNPTGLLRLLRNSHTEELNLVVSALVRYSKQKGADAIRVALDQTEPTIQEFPNDEANCFRAKLALIAYGLEDWERVDRVLCYAKDPGARNYFIHWFRPSELAVEPLLSRFANYSDDWKATAVLGCLATLPASRISDSVHGIVFDAFKNHPSSGVHSLSKLLLMEWGKKEWVEAAELSADYREIRMDRNWYLNSQAMQMNIVRGPKEFWFGYPSSSKKPGKQRQIKQSFAVAEKMISEREYAVFDPSKFPDPKDAPATHLTWFEAVKYCDWMNRQEGIEDRDSIEFDVEDSDKFRYTASRDGYRLISVSEWECYFRAGTETDFVFGNSNAAYFNDCLSGKPCSKIFFGPIYDDAFRTKFAEWVSTSHSQLSGQPSATWWSADEYAIAKRGYFNETTTPIFASGYRVAERYKPSSYGFRLSRSIR